MRSQQTAGNVRFAGFELDLRTGELLKNGRRTRLQAQPLKALRVLLEHAGGLVTREHLQREVWPQDTFVDFDHGLNKAIAKLRDVLDDPDASSSVIETLPRLGYRFVPPVEWVAVDNESEPAPLRPDRLPDAPLAPPEPSLKHWYLFSGVVLTTVLIAAGFFYRRTISANQPAKPVVRSIAVLPLENLSGDPQQDYFADGMTDELITMLAKYSSTRIISRTSVMHYKGAHRPLRDIAHELGADAVVEGSIVRVGDKVRVTAQLIYALTDTHLWAESYERDVKDVIALQREVAHNIASNVNASFSRSGKPLHPINPAAHDAYLRGRYYWFADRDYPKSREFFEKAIQLQPDYAAAWAGLADSLIVLAASGKADPRSIREKAEQCVRRALELDDSSEEAHLSNAAAHLFLHWDWQAADQESQRSIALNPNFAEAHHLRSYILQAMNRLDESLEEAKKAIDLDPAARPWGLGYALLLTHHLDAAVEELRQRSDVHPEDPFLHLSLSDVYSIKGMPKEAFSELVQGLKLSAKLDLAKAAEKAYASGNYRDVLTWELSVMRKQASRHYVSPMRLAENCALLGDRVQTLHYLDLAYQEHAAGLIRVHIDPNFDFLHTDPHYQSLLKQIGLSLVQ